MICTWSYHINEIFTKAYFVVAAVIKHVERVSWSQLKKIMILPQKQGKAKERKKLKIHKSMRVHCKKRKYIMDDKVI